MVSPFVADNGTRKMYYMNVDANVGERSPNKPDDVQLVQFAFTAMAASTKFSPADRAIFGAVVPGAPYTGSPGDPLSLAIRRHQALRGGTQDGHVSSMKTTTLSYGAGDGPHFFQLVSMINHIRDFTRGQYPRIDRHPKCPPLLQAKVKNFCGDD